MLKRFLAFKVRSVGKLEASIAIEHSLCIRGFDDAPSLSNTIKLASETCAIGLDLRSAHTAHKTLSSAQPFKHRNGLCIELRLRLQPQQSDHS
uniref:Uncharacterized protein n=1 Tax=Ascaris lumbricoides TaxID=6252 RepID=A0A0M3HUK2_ASCLU